MVAQTSFLGDVVLTTPLLMALRTHLRPRRLAVLVRPEAAGLLAEHPAVDDVLLDDKRGADRGLRGMQRVIERVRAQRFDVVVSPHRSLRTALVLAAAGIPRRVGYANARGAWLFHERVPRDPRQHDVQRVLGLMAPFGGWHGSQALHLAVTSTAAQAANALLPADATRIVGLAPGSVWNTKRWTTEGFAAVARALAQDGVRCVLLGGPADQAACDAVAQRAGEAVVNLAGRTTIETLVAVIDRLELLVANDSAPMHVACARNVPVVAIFCATTPSLGYGPWGERTAVVEVDLDCRPCGRHGSHHCPRGTDDCRYLVTPDMVLAAVRSLRPHTGGHAG